MPEIHSARWNLFKTKVLAALVVLAHLGKKNSLRTKGKNNSLKTKGKGNSLKTKGKGHNHTVLKVALSSLLT